MGDRPVSIGVANTSWWADLMYMPAFKNHPDANVVAVCGRDPERTRAFAEKWDIPHYFTDFDAMVDSGLVDAVFIGTINKYHHPMTMKALDAGLHVLCEKPLAMNVAEAQAMHDKAVSVGTKCMATFTYRFMPTARYVKRLLDEGYIGKPYQLNLRYYTGTARAAGYEWRFDMAQAGAGMVGDIGSHFIYLAQWYYGEIESVMCMLGYHIERADRPDGVDYERGDDSASILLQFKNGAQGVVVATAVGYEDTPLGQTHHMELHGSEGTLYSFIDWDTIQQVRGARVGEGMIKELPIPDDIWGSVRHDTVMNTYKDTFHQENHMARGWVTSIVEDAIPEPTFAEALHVQKVIAACQVSAKEGRRVYVDDMV
ncbi:MAG: Gfo/Idh/MocA family oxidoreductase [Anaerolineaceae bacterium]|nr:Gfo/Idh/MocA family oxidoreductase [Anaerolineaceae bacterium]